MIPTLIYSDHAAERMRQRDFKESQIRALLARGPSTRDPIWPRRRVTGMVGDREARLVYVVEDRETILIVSIMWTDEQGDPKE